MSTALHLAKPEDLGKVLTLVAAFHQESGIDSTEELRQAGIEPLLNGHPYGAVYLIGPTRAPIGYIVITFGWSVEYGGLDGYVDELYVRPAVRGRGIATEVLTELPKSLAGVGMRAISLEVDRDNETAQQLYLRTRFQPRGNYILMTKEL